MLWNTSFSFSAASDVVRSRFDVDDAARIDDRGVYRNRDARRRRNLQARGALLELGDVLTRRLLKLQRKERILEGGAVVAERLHLLPEKLLFARDRKEHVRGRKDRVRLAQLRQRFVFLVRIVERPRLLVDRLRLGFARVILCKSSRCHKRDGERREKEKSSFHGAMRGQSSE
ncbi:MAG TPA: hypothetical protein VF407_03350 [Polyangiaceae bacterium]